MDETREALLQPSLSGAGTHSAAPYSMQAVFITAFFGGPLALLVLTQLV